MPAGKPWVTKPPAMRPLAVDPIYWHVYHADFAPLSANPFSKARLALVDPEGGKKSAFGMFYLASDFAGALWEVVLRYVEPDDARNVRVDIATLAGMRAVRLRLRRDGVPQLELGQPGLRMLFAADSPESVAVASLIAAPDHRTTHAEAAQLREDLMRVGVGDMPVLAWPSRQHNPSTVYLAYAPPMAADWWELVDDPQPLDTPAGHALIRAELERCGFHWVPLETNATPAPEEP
jgi:hypothetical protein